MHDSNNDSKELSDEKRLLEPIRNLFTWKLFAVLVDIMHDLKRITRLQSRSFPEAQQPAKAQRCAIRDIC